MLLTLVPPTSYPIPLPLQTHTLTPPFRVSSFKHRDPAAYTRARKALNDLGLSLPSSYCADRALWWSLAVEEVTWDLDAEMVEVRFSDGSEERWEMSHDFGADDDEGRGREEPKSAEFVEESQDEEEVTPMEVEDDDNARRQRSAAPPPAAPPRPRPPSRASVLHARLLDLSKQLRSGYEDLSMGSVNPSSGFEVNSDANLENLVDLAANPSIDLPSEWRADGFESAEEEQESVTDEEKDDEEVAEQLRLRRKAISPELVAPSPSPSPPTGSRTATATPARTIVTRSVAARDKYTGKFPLQRRARSLAELYRDNDVTPPPFSPTIDLYSFVHLLEQTRTTLIDGYSSLIIPTLRTRLNAPTYSIWAVRGAIGWCRREATRRAAQAAKHILSLLDDDGETFDVTDDEQDDGSSEVEDSELEDESEWGSTTIRGKGEKSEQRLERNRERRWEKNVLWWDSGFDAGLRTWCERALDKARELGEEVELWGVARLKKDANLADRVVWTKKIEPWEVWKSYKSRKDGLDSDDDDEEDMLSDSSHGHVHSAHPSSNYFYPANPLFEQWLPKKLPWSLVRPRVAIGKQMEQIRMDIIIRLSEVAGLQKKVIELQEFIGSHSVQWDLDKEDERKPKPPTDTPALSSLRNPSAIVDPSRPPPSPPSPPTSPKNIPLSKQPLRLAAADRVVSTAVLTAIKGNTLGSASPVSTDILSILGGGAAGPSPRKRQRDNLAFLEKLNRSRLPAPPLGTSNGSSSSSTSTKRKKVKTKDKKGSKAGSSIMGPPNPSAGGGSKGKNARKRAKFTLFVHEDAGSFADDDDDQLVEDFGMQLHSTRNGNEDDPLTPPTSRSSSPPAEDIHVSEGLFDPVPSPRKVKPTISLAPSLERKPVFVPPPPTGTLASEAPRLTLQQLGNFRNRHYSSIVDPEDEEDEDEGGGALPRVLGGWRDSPSSWILGEEDLGKDNSLDGEEEEEEEMDWEGFEEGEGSTVASSTDTTPDIVVSPPSPSPTSSLPLPNYDSSDEDSSLAGSSSEDDSDSDDDSRLAPPRTPSPSHPGDIPVDSFSSKLGGLGRSWMGEVKSSTAGGNEMDDLRRIHQGEQPLAGALSVEQGRAPSSFPKSWSTNSISNKSHFPTSSERERDHGPGSVDSRTSQATTTSPALLGLFAPVPLRPRAFVPDPLPSTTNLSSKPIGINLPNIASTSLPTITKVKTRSSPPRAPSSSPKRPSLSPLAESTLEIDSQDDEDDDFELILDMRDASSSSPPSSSASSFAPDAPFLQHIATAVLGARAEHGNDSMRLDEPACTTV